MIMPKNIKLIFISLLVLILIVIFIFSRLFQYEKLHKNAGENYITDSNSEIEIEIPVEVDINESDIGC
jgi:hypothetical protein